jgi:signal transduction histidine kinase
MVGLGLVIGIMALLLAGTLRGLLSYNTTMKTMDSKLAELNTANALKNNITQLMALTSRTVEATETRPPEPRLSLEGAQAPAVPFDRDRSDLETNAAEAVRTLQDYEQKLDETLARRLDPGEGEIERELVKALEHEFGELKTAVGNFYQPESTPQGPTRRLFASPQVTTAIAKLNGACDQLQSAIYNSMENRLHLARGHYRTSLWLVLITSGVGLVVLLVGLHFFYNWVFRPIRDLHLGAERVAQGHFEHRIEVHSGDEMEDLSTAFNDMTSRLQEMYRDLARQVNERSRQLVRSERLASVGFLAAGVAHEINNPLASIAFCSEALEARLADLAGTPAWGAKTPTARDADLAVITRYLKMIQEEAFRCKRITERLLEFSRSSQRRREPTDLGAVIVSVLDVTQHLQNGKGKEIILSGPIERDAGGRVVAWVNGEEIKSVVLNLVVNALNSMDEGGTLTVRLGQKHGMAEMEFTDTGCGMPPEVLENIFEPFFTRSRTGEGTGLGLTISHRIITQHGGEIEATSPGPGQGSTFTVRLPLQPAEEQDSPPAEPPTERRRRTA